MWQGKEVLHKSQQKKNLEIARAARKSAGKSVARAARKYSAAMKGRIIKSSENQMVNIALQIKIN